MADTASTPDPAVRPIFRAGRQLTLLRLILPLCLVCGVGSLWGGWIVLHTYGLHPTEGGILRPLPQRLLVGAPLMALGAFICVGIIVYMFCYVSRIDRLAEEDRYRLTLAGLVTSPVLTVSERDIVRGGYHDGRYRAGGVAVAAPWYTLRLRGRRLPLIVDAQGDVLDEDAFDSLVYGDFS